MEGAHWTHTLWGPPDVHSPVAPRHRWPISHAGRPPGRGLPLQGDRPRSDHHAHAQPIQGPQTRAGSMGSGAPSARAAVPTWPTLHALQGGPSLAGAGFHGPPPCHLLWPGSWSLWAGCDTEGKTSHWQSLISVFKKQRGSPQQQPPFKHSRFTLAPNPPPSSPKLPWVPRCCPTDGLGTDG